jgi:arylsulfatase A-like enzyme
MPGERWQDARDRRWLRPLLALVVCLAAACGPAPPPRPNVLIVSVDTLNRSALPCYDEEAEALPVLDAFAAEARVFEHALSTASWTLPAHASLMTGLYPDRHGATQEHLRIGSSVETLADLLEERGYDTVGFTGGGFVDGAYGFAEGFERYDDTMQPGYRATVDLPRDGAIPEVPGEALFDRAIRWLRGRRGDAPFLAFVQTFSVHEYYRGRLWDESGLDGLEPAGAEHYLACLLGEETGSAEDWRVLRALYQAEVRHVDAGFGRLLAALEEQGLADSTLVVFVSDHGEGLHPERGRRHHGGRLDRDLIRVPLLVRGPGVVPGRCASSISLVDVMPTLLDALGVPVPGQLDGRSFADLLDGRGTFEGRPVIAEEYGYRWEDGRRVAAHVINTRPLATAVVGEDLWYVRKASGKERLSRRAGDAGKPVDPAQFSSEMEELRELVRERIEDRTRPELVSGDDELLERLRSLGYVDG